MLEADLPLWASGGESLRYQVLRFLLVTMMQGLSAVSGYELVVTRQMIDIMAAASPRMVDEAAAAQRAVAVGSLAVRVPRHLDLSLLLLFGASCFLLEYLTPSHSGRFSTSQKATRWIFSSPAIHKQLRYHRFLLPGCLTVALPILVCLRPKPVIPNMVVLERSKS
jgi:hypothetical protein